MTDSLSEALLGGASLPPLVYLHVPFCRSKCSYCDFASVAGSTEEQVLAVYEGLRSELRRWATSSLPGVVDTLYVGGGTPTLFAGETARLVDFARCQLPMRDRAEVTVEANPDSFDEEVAHALAGAGATRVSIGIQSFDDTVLGMLGRAHDAKRAQQAIAAAVKTGLDVSIDLMCGVPGQSISSWQESLDHATRSGAVHVSVYPLSVEEGTPLAVAIDSGLVQEPDPDVAAAMMTMAEEVLGRAGMDRYEIASYARRGYESRHNSGYWTGRMYLGIGPASHGMLDATTAAVLGILPDASDVARVRYMNTADIDAWLFGAEWETEQLSCEEVSREDVMLGLRMNRGVPQAQVAAAGLTGVLDDLAAQGLTELVDGRWRTTRTGWLLGNEVFGRVWAGE